MSNDGMRQVANVLSVLLALTVNALALFLPLNGQTQSEISARLPTYFTPAGYIFGIWSLIFLGWIAFAIYQVQPAQRDNPRLRNLGYSFALSNVLIAAWLFCWHYNQFGLSVLAMLLLLGSVITSYLKLNIGRVSPDTAEKWFIDIVFSIYLGWISVATIANIAAWLVSIQWDGFGLAPQVWAAIMITIASILGILMMFARRDSGYVFVLAWAFAGIAVNQANEPLVASIASVAAALATGLGVFSGIQRRRRSP